MMAAVCTGCSTSTVRGYTADGPAPERTVSRVRYSTYVLPRPIGRGEGLRGEEAAGRRRPAHAHARACVSSARPRRRAAAAALTAVAAGTRGADVVARVISILDGSMALDAVEEKAAAAGVELAERRARRARVWSIFVAEMWQAREIERRSWARAP